MISETKQAIQKLSEHLESIDTILKNLKMDKNYYNHGMTQDDYMLEENRND